MTTILWAALASSHASGAPVHRSMIMVTSQSYVLPPFAPSLGGRTAVTATRSLAAWPHEDACAGGVAERHEYPRS